MEVTLRYTVFSFEDGVGVVMFEHYCPTVKAARLVAARFQSYVIYDRMTGKVVASRGISPEWLAREFPGS